MKQSVGFGTCFNNQSTSDIIFGKVNRLFEEPLDLFICEPIRRLHFNRALTTCAHVGRRNVEDAVRINHKRHFYAWHPGRLRLNRYFEACEAATILDKLALAL